MNKYYKVTLKSEHKSIDYPNIIVKSGILYVKEITTNEPIMICDNEQQGFMYDYYILRSDLNDENMVMLDDVKKYIKAYDPNTFPSVRNHKKEQKEIDNFLKARDKKGGKYFKVDLLSYKHNTPNILGFGKLNLNVEKTIILKRQYMIYRELCTGIRLDISRSSSDSLDEIGKQRIFVSFRDDYVSRKEIEEYMHNFDYEEFENILKKDDYYRKKIESKTKVMIKKGSR